MFSTFDAGRDRAAALLRPVRRALLARRRPLAAVCAVVAVLAGFRAAAAPPPLTEPVTVAARDLPAGTLLSGDDLTTAEFAPGTAPEGLADKPLGRSLAAPVGRGEPVTDTRLVGGDLTAGHPGLVALPVRLPDPAMADLLRVGDTIDLLAADPQGGPPAVVTTSARVVAVPSVSDEAAADGLPGRLVLLAVTAVDVPAVVDASVTRYLAYAYAK